MPEEEAYDTLKYLMVNLGLRRQYRPDMESLQVGLVYHFTSILILLGLCICSPLDMKGCALKWQIHPSILMENGGNYFKLDAFNSLKKLKDQIIYCLQYILKEIPSLHFHK